jgi:hypothetical protein
MSFTLAPKHNTAATNAKTSTLTRTTKSTNKKKQNNDNNLYNISKMNSSNPIVHLQKSIGNHAVQKLMHANPDFDLEIAIQPKLKISHSEDAYEQEADKVAEEVMKMSSSSSGSNTKLLSPTSSNEVVDRKKCSECEMKEEEVEEEKVNISRKPLSNSSDLEASDEISNQISNIRAGADSGLVPDSFTKEFMESRFGHDFSKVRIHTGEMASSSANAVNAVAYTVGNDIIFGEGQYRPHTLEGRKLLAHELTHVVQQSSNNNTASTSAGLITSKLSSAERISRQKETKSTSAEELEKQFQQARLKSDWTDAVDRLAVFSITDIPKLLERYMITQSELHLLKKAAISKFGSEGNRIVSAINSLIESKK